MNLSAEKETEMKQEIIELWINVLNHKKSFFKIPVRLTKEIMKKALYIVINIFLNYMFVW